MSRYLATVRTSNPETLDGLQPGQWIDYDGAKGRYMGRKNGSVWIAWGATARKRFAEFAMAFHITRPEPSPMLSTWDYSVVLIILAIAVLVLSFASGIIGDGATTWRELLSALVVWPDHWS